TTRMSAVGEARPLSLRPRSSPVDRLDRSRLRSLGGRAIPCPYLDARTRRVLRDSAPAEARLRQTAPAQTKFDNFIADAVRPVVRESGPSLPDGQIAWSPCREMPKGRRDWQ